MRFFYFLLLSMGLTLGISQASAATEMEDRQNISEMGRTLFVQENFEKLETVFQTFRSERTRTASGLWKLTVLYAGLEDCLSGLEGRSKYGLGYTDVYAKISKWVAKYPSSPTPQIFRGIVMVHQAWARLEEGETPPRNPAQLKAFYQQIESARQHLLKAKPIASIDPRWYEQMLKIARTTRLGQGDFDALLQEALEREPLFYQNYFRALEYLLTTQSGNQIVIDNFVAKAVERTMNLEGKGMYARIYWYAAQTEFGNALFTESPVQWKMMREGFDAVIKRYPDEWNLSNYAKFACLAGDQTTSRSILEQLGPRVVREAWYPRSLLTSCAVSQEPSKSPNVASLAR
jgi:hypothetical protein